MFTIYGIIDPRDHRIFYVGYTRNLKTRKEYHREEGNCNGSPRIRELLSLGIEPHYCILEQCQSSAEALDVETTWIQTLKKAGAPLLNQENSANRQTKRERRQAQKFMDRKIPARKTAKAAGPAGEEKPANEGKKWTAELDEALGRLFAELIATQSLEDTMAALARHFERGRGGIRSRLVRRGHIRKIGSEYVILNKGTAGGSLKTVFDRHRNGKA